MKLACPCGEHIETAHGPRRLGDQGSYGPGLVGHLMTAKCADSIPFYRLAKQYKRAGVPLSRSTMGDLFHAGAAALQPIYRALMRDIAKSDVVLGDETTVRLQKSTSKGWMWTFLSPAVIGYRFSASRSGATPQEVLGGSSGTLVADAYTGYNHVCTPDQRKRAGCLAHARRKLYEAARAGACRRGAGAGLDLGDLPGRARRGGGPDRR